MATTLLTYPTILDSSPNQWRNVYLTTTCNGKSYPSLKEPLPPLMERLLTSEKKEAFSQILNTCLSILIKPGVHSVIKMRTGGFYYTGKGDTGRCDICELEVSGWTADMDPFETHAQRNPSCPYVQEMRPEKKFFMGTMANAFARISATKDEEKPTKRQKVEDIREMSQPNILVEVNLLKQMRRRTFSHWPHRTSSLSSQMIEAGFFNCNVGDRVICIYCNLICQQWTPNSDDPWEVHKTHSPRCPYVTATLKQQQQTASIRIVNEQSTTENALDTNNNDPFRLNEIVYTAACHPTFHEIPRRYASFATWPNENAPSADDLVRAGFFYTGTKTIVTCFYCNGSLQNWGANDNPTIEHARWFPHCAYAKQLCGADLYRIIQESKRAQQERARLAESNRQNGSSGGGGGNNDSGLGRGQLNIPDESTLSKYVTARLDLSISQNMLDRNFKLSIIKRCWEDQLRLKLDDFVDFCDLFLACMILQRQIECIDGKKENINVAGVKMNEVRAALEAEAYAHEKVPSTSSNLCVLCLEEEKRVACIPCGHLVTCVPCGHSLRSCPICRTGIDTLKRIYR